MKNVIFPVSLFFGLMVFSGFPAPAQEFFEENPFSLFKSESLKSLPPPKFSNDSLNSQIKDVQVFGEQSGIVFTRTALYRTDDDGGAWREIVLSKNSSEIISIVFFKNKNAGSAILADEQNLSLQIARTQDGGNSWTKTPIYLRQEDLREAVLENAALVSNRDGDFTLTFRLPTSSNFVGTTTYKSSNDGQTWEFSERLIEIRHEDTASAEKISENWTLKTVGSCEGSKVGCVQETRVFNQGTEITPPQIKELSRIEKENARLEAQKSVFAAPPNGSTRISLNHGFDKCAAAPPAQMQTWWNTSPFYDVNIYISGRNRGCQQLELTAAWVTQVSAMGWGLIPTIVGHQAPCSSRPTSAKHSSDLATAETQGRGEADIAINDANNLGLTQGTILYYDMERYDETSGTPGCRLAVRAFLKGWTDRLKEKGYISGVYGSPTNAVNDWTQIPEASRMDAVWLARYDNIPSVWTYAPPSPIVPSNFWSNHQRIKQWQGPHNETWGGVTFNIDGDILDAPVAGVAIPKNKNADFDGDGKTDVSVFRPDTGIWYVLSSSNSSFSGVGFGGATDVLAPGDCYVIAVFGGSCAARARRLVADNRRNQTPTHFRDLINPSRRQKRLLTTAISARHINVYVIKR